MRLLLVEDDPMLARSLATNLEREGHVVDRVENGFDAMSTLREPEHALVLLDLGLPGVSGLNILKRMRSHGLRTPIIIITAKDQIEDRIEGLDCGADDYLVKPFSLGELLARIRAVLRRASGHVTTTLVIGDISIDLATHAVEFQGRTAILPPREFAIVESLAMNAGKILSRAQIEEKIYGWGEEVGSNAVDVLIHSIRRKFGRGIISNIRGAGWLIVKD